MSAEAMAWAFSLENISPGAKFCAIVIANSGEYFNAHEMHKKLVLTTGYSHDEIAQFVGELLMGGVFEASDIQSFRHRLSLPREPKKYWVYLIHSRRLGIYKIGYTSDPKERIKDIKEQRKDNTLHYVTHIPTKDPIGLEAELHGTFQDKCVGGEWFALDDMDIDLIRGLAGAGS